MKKPRFRIFYFNEHYGWQNMLIFALDNKKAKGLIKDENSNIAFVLLK